MPAKFERIAYFLCVCENGSVSAAAEQLYISPQALNKQIRTLEEELGEKLFLRAGRRLELTEFGTYFRNQMQPVHQLYRTAQSQIRHYLDRSGRTLRVGFFQGVPKRQVIQPLITELMLSLPEVQIELGSAEMDEIYENLRGGKIDLAVANINPMDNLSDLVQIPLLSLPCKIVVSCQHPWVEKPFVTVEDMRSNPVLFLARAKGPDRKGFYAELKASSYHYASTYNAMLAQLGLGQQYAVFPTLYENLAESGLKTFPLPEQYGFDFQLALLYRPDSPFAAYFSTLSALREEIGKLLPREN